MGTNISFGNYTPSQDEPDNEDFLPIVKINDKEVGKNAIYSIETCDSCKKQILNLGGNFDKELREYVIPEITIAKKSKSYIPLKTIQGYDGIGYQDGDGILEFKCSNTKVKFRLLDKSNPEKCDDNTKVYDVTDAAEGDKYTLEISHDLERGSKFYIEVWASDDNDGLWGKSGKVVKCGKFNFTVVERDVFMKEEVDKLIEEMIYIGKKFHENPREQEYNRNYCTFAADRGLGKLLNNDPVFYTVKTINGKDQHIGTVPSMLDANKRANALNSMGYVKNSLKFGNSKNQKTFNIAGTGAGVDSKKIKVTIIPNAVYPKFKENIRNLIGYHCYYISLDNACHTLLMVINNTNPCQTQYAIYDDEGLSSAHGELRNIEKKDNPHDGLAYQVEWILEFMKRTANIDASPTTIFYKIQRK